MKSTMLACAAQLSLPKEHRLAQGHHRDSALLYSRNDIFSSLLVQRTACICIADGFRPERSLARGGQMPLPEPPFRAPAQHPAHSLPAMDMHAGPWIAFTSRREELHADPQIKVQKTPQAEHSTSKTVLDPETDPEVETVHSTDTEADAVAAWAHAHEDPGDEDEAEPSIFATARGHHCGRRLQSF